LDDLQEHPLSTNLDLNSFLIIPVQRVPRYVMLLTEFINNTDKSHPDYEDLSDSLNLMKNVADQINKSMKENENKLKCIELQNIFTEEVELVEAHREYVFEGELTKQCRKIRKFRKFWLFNDILLYGKPMPTTSKYILSCTMELENFSVKDIEDDPSIDLINAMELTSKSKSFIVFAATPQDKTNWMNHFKLSIEGFSNKRKTFALSSSESIMEEDLDQAPVWVPDVQVNNCPLCNAKFTIIYRKHHCRKCGIVVCDGCSKGKAFVTNVSTKEVRVCDNCMEKN